MAAYSSDKACKCRAKVTFSYTAKNEDELSLMSADIVEILEDDEDGWWRGRIHEKEGVFPCNFVKPFVDEEDPAPLPDTISSPALSKPSKSNNSWTLFINISCELMLIYSCYNVIVHFKHRITMYKANKSMYMFVEL